MKRTDKIRIEIKERDRRLVDLKSFRDDIKICKNPHKGWYFHYYDQSLTKYSEKLSPDDFLLDFPGLNHIYFRLAWSYLEPEEGKYNWRLFDDVIEKWREHGYNVAFRVTCKETAKDQIFATPEWVKDAGAKGTFIPNPWNGEWANWEPDYADPIFLEKLENFHMAFAEHYDDKPWVEYIDIGSYGDWGEGHTVWTSKKDWPVEVIKKHVEMYRRCYKNSILVINDDFVGCRYTDPDVWEELLDYFVESGLAFRDDSVCVAMYDGEFGYNTLRYPEFFERFWRKKPIDLECEHYHLTVESGAWKKGFPFMAAVEDAHATYIGFQGYPREWLEDNYDIAERLANKSGYWYFVNSLDLPSSFKQGLYHRIGIEWENKGVAPAYNYYKLAIALTKVDGGSDSIVQVFENSGNINWFPGKPEVVKYGIKIPGDLKPGTYSLKLSLFEERCGEKKHIELALKDKIKGTDNFYTLANIQVEAR